MEHTSKNLSSGEAADIFYLLLKTARILNFEFEKRLTSMELPIPVSGPRLRLLMEVWKAEQIRMNELASKMDLQPRTITDFVNALERDGLLQRLADPTDRRATLLTLTDTAKPHIMTVRAVSAEISEQLMENLCDNQRRQLIDLLLALS